LKALPPLPTLNVQPVPVWPVSVCSQTTTNSSEVNE
jgi:hypothetical protein